MQKMFNIFHEEGEELSENAKLRGLFNRTQHPQSQDTVNTQAANHLSAGVSELAEYQMTRKVLVVTRIRGGQKISMAYGCLMEQYTLGTIRIGTHCLKRTRTRCWLNGRREALTSLVTLTKGKATSTR